MPDYISSPPLVHRFLSLSRLLPIFNTAPNFVEVDITMKLVEFRFKAGTKYNTTEVATNETSFH